MNTLKLKQLFSVYILKYIPIHTAVTTLWVPSDPLLFLLNLTWWASSWAIIIVIQSLEDAEDLSGSYNNADSRYVVNPQFSIAPDWKSGIAAKSGGVGRKEEGGEGSINKLLGLFYPVKNPVTCSSHFTTAPTSHIL